MGVFPVANDGQQNDQPDPQQQNDGGGGDGQNPESDPAAEKFWKQMDERLDAAIARGVSKHVPRASKPGTARSGRTTLPEMIAQFMGGPFAPEKDKK